MVKTVVMYVLLWLLIALAYIMLKASDKTIKKRLAKSLLVGGITAIISAGVAALIINIF